MIAGSEGVGFDGEGSGVAALGVAVAVIVFEGEVDLVGLGNVGFGGGTRMKYSDTISEMRVCISGLGGTSSVPRTNPPRAWQASVRRVSVGARRFERTEGRTALMNAGTKMEGAWMERSWTA